jgi:para-nitrobenzyl esterase
MAFMSGDVALSGNVVPTASGPLAGLRTGLGLEFLGIPYATAPRFSPPGRPSPWSGVREAVVPGRAAPQPRRLIGSFTHGELPATAEECLNLNIYTPSLEGRRPVLVWLHGGAFTLGNAAASVYRGARLAVVGDVVVVTLNYRLGSLGWLAHRDLADASGAPCGNWGLLDQLAALAWVRENIAGFGGDPGRVTLAGQSAGGLSAWLLLAAPGAEGLFHQAVLESPPINGGWQDLEAGERWANALSELAAGASGFDRDLLRGLSAERIVELHEALLGRPGFRGTRGGALPTVGAGLTGTPRDRPGVNPDVPVLIGTTADEGTFYFDSPWTSPTAAGRLTSVASRLLGVADPADELARYAERAAARGRTGATGTLVELATDAMFARPVAAWSTARANALAGTGAPVYRYRVDHPGAGPAMRATHCVEVPLLFGTWDDAGPGQRLGGAAPGATYVSAAISTAWARFIHGEDPGWRPLGEDAQLAVFGGARPLTIDDLNTW